MSAINRQDVSTRRDQFIDSWRKFAPEMSIAGYTLAQFVAESQAPDEIRQRLSAARTEVAGTIIERQAADNRLKEKLIMLTDTLRGTPSYGYDSPFYRSIGFVPKSERKRPVRQPKAVVAAPMAIAAVPMALATVPMTLVSVPIPPSANVA